MSDLLALQPNLDLALYLVAPDERRAKVRQEIARPTFAYREKPLPRVCGFVSFERLMEQVEGIRRLGLATSLRPEFLKRTAEYFDEGEEWSALHSGLGSGVSRKVSEADAVGRNR